MSEQFLRNISLFENLTSEELIEVVDMIRERTYRKGSVIISEGNKNNDIYILKEGKVKIYKSSNDSKDFILNIKSNGSILSGSTLFSELPSPATIMTIENSIIYVIKSTDIETLIKSNSKLAINLIKFLSKELQNALEKVKNMALNDAYVRTAKLLLDLSNTFGVLIGDSVLELNISLTREEMGSLIGSSRETVSRALSQLNKEKIIDTSSKNILINNRDKLEEWLK